MAEVDTTQLSQEHGAIRHDLAVESARLGAQIGAEACALNQAIGDGRQEQAENFGHTRRDIQATAADLSRYIGDGFCATDSKILETGSSVRREAAEHTNEIVKEGLKSNHDTRGDIKDARYDIANRIGAEGDRMVDRTMEVRNLIGERFYTVGRDLADLRQGQATLSKDIELNSMKGMLENQKNTQYLADKIVQDGEKTRGLINDLKYHDLNRGLVERNTELVNCEQSRDDWRHRYDDARWSQRQDQFGAQFAQLQTQIQAFASQLQETRQGMVNFGTMAGVGQTSSSNNV